MITEKFLSIKKFTFKQIGCKEEDNLGIAASAGAQQV
jgi:hypothetical protein